MPVLTRWGEDRPLVDLLFHQALKYKMQTPNPLAIKPMISAWIGGGYMSWEVAVVSVSRHLCSPCHQGWGFLGGVAALGRRGVPGEQGDWLQ